MAVSYTCIVFRCRNDEKVLRVILNFNSLHLCIPSKTKSNSWSRGSRCRRLSPFELTKFLLIIYPRFVRHRTYQVANDDVVRNFVDYTWLVAAHIFLCTPTCCIRWAFSRKNQQFKRS